MKVLITGGNGFIARNLTERLGSEYQILAPNSQDLNLLDSDGVANCIKNHSFDVVIHTATYDAAPKHSTKDPAKVLENNLKMFFNVARCSEHFGKMIYFGSGAEFGREHWKHKMSEVYFDQHVPEDQYGFSKYIMTRHAQLSQNIYNLRIFAVFGKYEDWRVRFISNACARAIYDLPITINQNVFFDFMCIDDLVEIVRWFMHHQPRQHVYNVCTGQVIDFKTLADQIIAISGKKLDVIVKTDGLGKEYSGDNSMLLNELDGFAFTPLEKSVEDLYRWYECNKHLIDKDKL
jgi:UDP-glucose 4-epimerase